MKILKKFMYNDKVLEKKIPYAEIKLPKTTHHIHNIPITMSYVYDTPLDKLHDKRFYKLPFDNPDINTQNLEKAY